MQSLGLVVEKQKKFWPGSDFFSNFGTLSWISDTNESSFGLVIVAKVLSGLI